MIYTHHMSKRLQVILADDDAQALQQMAVDEGVTVSEWVRQTLRNARRQRATIDVEQRLDTIRAATRHSFPAPDIDQMLEEIERGYPG